jgi:hypothetical protein
MEGRIEALQASGIAAGSADLVISNCVVNLSPDKPQARLCGPWQGLPSQHALRASPGVLSRVRSPDPLRLQRATRPAHQACCRAGACAVS